ncbi:MAG: peptidylprolyl isomerase [Eggerthellaceae bacterium]|nr:peptidylprolyl isomerase [Eggerthellaceae bacterium]
MNIIKLIKTLAVFGLASACVCLLVSCTDSGNNEPKDPTTPGLTGGIAASVNGVEISEDTVTSQIQNARAIAGYMDTDNWGTYLVLYGQTPESIRTDFLGSLIDEELIKQAIAEYEITIPTFEIDEKVNLVKRNYLTEEAWQQALAGAGLTEPVYRERIELALQKAKLRETVAPPTEATKEEVLEYINLILPDLDGAKRSSHILFESGNEELAQDVLRRINSGELDFADAAQLYSKDTGSALHGGDVMWDKLTTFVSAYQEGLNGLSLDQVSGLIVSEYGIHIIKCTNIFSAPASVTEESQVPVEFVEALRYQIQSMNQETAYADWFDAYKEDATIITNPLPNNAPYNIDLTKYLEMFGLLDDEDETGGDPLIIDDMTPENMNSGLEDGEGEEGGEGEGEGEEGAGEETGM